MSCDLLRKSYDTLMGDKSHDFTLKLDSTRITRFDDKNPLQREGLGQSLVINQKVTSCHFYDHGQRRTIAILGVILAA